MISTQVTANSSNQYHTQPMVQMLNDFADPLTSIHEACHTTPALLLSGAYIYLEGRESSRRYTTTQMHSRASLRDRIEKHCLRLQIPSYISIISSFPLHPTIPLPFTNAFFITASVSQLSIMLAKSQGNGESEECLEMSEPGCVV